MEQLIEAIKNLLSAQRELQKCYDSCENDPSYFCHSEQGAVDICLSELKSAFKEAVREAIAELQDEE